jgi:hypothetical protein
VAKLTEFQNPISGKTGNLFDLGNLWQMILGVVVFMGVFAVGEKIAGSVNGKIPGVSTQPGPIFASPQVQATVVQKEVI